MSSNLEFHHTGIAVVSITETLPHYIQLFGQRAISEIYTINEQKVKVCFIKVGNNSYIELVEGLDENSSIQKMAKKGISYYHIAYKTQNIEHTVKQLEEQGYKTYSYFNSEAFNNKRCVFLHNPIGHLIELIEK
jgi:methylmalonyl-CoA epimerase